MRTVFQIIDVNTYSYDVRTNVAKSIVFKSSFPEERLTCLDKLRLAVTVPVDVILLELKEVDDVIKGCSVVDFE